MHSLEGQGRMAPFVSLLPSPVLSRLWVIGAHAQPLATPAITGGTTTPPYRLPSLTESPVQYLA